MNFNYFGQYLTRISFVDANANTPDVFLNTVQYETEFTSIYSIYHEQISDPYSIKVV